MHDVSAYRHIDLAACPDVSETRPFQDVSCHAFALVEDAADHELDATASRQLRRTDDLLSAARFMIDGGFHPKANRTTKRLADVFAARMKDSKNGHFPFNITATAHALGLRRRAVLNHARYLRELGLIAYVEHGTKANVLRTRHRKTWQPGDGYAGTATIFTAVAPPVWDQALGRRIQGKGYRARLIGVTDHGRDLAVNEARRKASKKSPPRRTSCTPSSVVPKDHSRLKVEGGINYTPRKRATCRKNSPPTTSNQPRVTPAQCAAGITVADQLRYEVWWLHRACPRRLAYALRPLISTGWTWQSLAAELLTWGVPGFLRDPAAFVQHELARRQRTGMLILPHPPAADGADNQVDEDHRRHAEMLRQRHERSDPAWQRYAALLQPALRQHLAQSRQQQHEPQLARLDCPLLRENADDFARSLPAQSRGADISPQDIYRARAYGLPEPTGRRAPANEQGWLAHLNDQLKAQRAFAALRIELDDWEDGHRTLREAAGSVDAAQWGRS
ncbi:hypothetical protein ACFRKB_35105 [Streptomyces scopuliridis]|uniref:hypothetical protein n=1 Tax=Streptomyces scopuliridis TaxID=452529 RepID=UPI0036827D80